MLQHVMAQAVDIEVVVFIMVQLELGQLGHVLDCLLSLKMEEDLFPLEVEVIRAARSLIHISTCNNDARCSLPA